MRGKVILLSRDERLKKDFERALTEDIEFYAFSEVEKVGDADVIFLDVDSFGLSSLGLLKEKAFVIIVTAQRGTRYLIESMTFGAFDCVFRPLDRSKVRESLERALGIRSELEGELIEFPGEIEGSSVTCAIVGNSPALQEICKLIGQVGRVDVPVLITGESGTGKDLVAESIWKVSTRWEKPFVVINCAAIPETLLEAELFGYEKGAFTGAQEKKKGKFELANGGTLLLDEIGEIPTSIQAKLLRALQEKEIDRIGGREPIPVDVRIIATTNKDLYKECREGKFREDLYYRLSVFPLKIPPLRERKEDIPVLAMHFLKRFSLISGKTIEGFSEEAMQTLINRQWRGNVRELENVIQRAVFLCKGERITEKELLLEDEIQSISPANGRIENMERELILKTLKEVGGNKAKAARILGISVRTIRNKLKKYGKNFPEEEKIIERNV